MSSNVVISAEGLGKKYLIGHESADRSRTLRDAITGSVSKLGRSAMNMMRGEAIIEGDEIEEFWALRDLDFEIRQGDVVGVIGRNGAGKSTLLKILSRITEPSEGRVSIKGRVASLLEVGTGFHPELSGRENIFLNGAILGMGRAEIRRKFDEIVAFSEVERFLDTPVKRYSSGMYVRLAFAVAADLEPEILIVDEVLAVGDATFQKKCLGKMRNVAGEGRTVLFVSHNITSIQSLCHTGIHLQSGRIRFVGAIRDAIESYASESLIVSAYDLATSQHRSGEGKLKFSEITFRYPDGGQSALTGAPLDIRVTMSGEIGLPQSAGRISLAFFSPMGEIVFDCPSIASFPGELPVAPGMSYDLHLPRLPLESGEYIVSLFIERAGQAQDYVEVAAKIRVDDAPFFNTPRNSAPGFEGKLVLVPHYWNVSTESKCSD